MPSMKPQAIDRGRYGWAVRWPDNFDSAMPDEATARRCAAASEMLQLLTEASDANEAAENEFILGEEWAKKTEQLLLYVNQARQA